MPPFKQAVVSTSGGPTIQMQPVVVSLDLTPQQRMLITNATGQCPSRLELTASELQLILEPRLIEIKEG